MSFLNSLSIKRKLILAHWGLTFLLVAIWLSTALIWIQKDQQDRLDTFLISEANLSKSSLEAYFNGFNANESFPTQLKSPEFKNFMAKFFVERSNRAFQYKTTLALYDANDQLVTTSNLALDLKAPEMLQRISKNNRVGVDLNTTLVTVDGESNPFRMISTALFHDDERVASIRLACLISSTSESILNSTVIVSFIFLLSMLSFGLVGTWLIERSFVPIKQMTETANMISEDHLDVRLPVPPGKDEMAFLAITFNELLERLERDYKFEEMLVGQLSHELRTPLTVLRGRNEMGLQKLKTKEEFHTLIEDNLSDIDSLVVLLNTMLTLARLESRMDRLILQRIDLASLLKDLIEDLQPLWEEKSIRFSFDLPEKTDQWTECPPLWALVDPTYFKQVITNVLTNAYKFSPVQSVIEISVEQIVEPTTKYWRIVFANEGPPIPEHALELIFKRFYRIENLETTDEHMPGFGLGLSIAKSLLELQKGRIRAFNPITGGAAFEILIPVATKLH